MGHSITQRQLVDRIAQYFVSAGGIAVIVAILAIFFFIFREITPLFSTPTARLIAHVALPSIQSSPGPVRIGMDEHRQIAYALHSGGAHFIDLASGRSVPVEVPLLLSHQRITAIAHGGGASSTYLLGTHEGGIVPVKLGVTTSFSDSGGAGEKPRTPHWSGATRSGSANCRTGLSNRARRASLCRTDRTGAPVVWKGP